MATVGSWGLTAALSEVENARANGDGFVVVAVVAGDTNPARVEAARDDKMNVFEWNMFSVTARVLQGHNDSAEKRGRI